MTSNVSFTRKVTYIAIIALLLIPLSILSRPATSKKVGKHFETNPGGTLAKMRFDAGLSQARLGEIDPASEAMKLATLGMRGIAVNILWDRANDYKKKENWDSLSATLEQISRLQPNFVSVWEFQAHNMTYNVSIEFDDYRQRYHWVKKGVDYLLEGTNFNRDEPRLLWYAGWVIGQKIGRSDERVQFRRMFRDDTEFHKLLLGQQIDIESAKGADGKPDNWLCGRLWYLKAQDAVNRGKSLRGKSPAVFHSSPIMSRVNYVSDLEKEPNFDEELVRAEWDRAYNEWLVYGERPLPTSAGFNVTLNGLERIQEQFKENSLKLENINPAARDNIIREKIAQLPADLRRALIKPEAERTPAEAVKAQTAESKVHPTVDELAAAAPLERSLEARKLAKELVSLSERERLTRTNRQVINFEFWRDRCQSGSTENSVKARKYLYEADELLAKPDLKGAHKKYELSFRAWAEVFKTWPILMEDADTADIIEAIEKYINVRDQLDLRDTSGGVLPPSFPLTALIEKKGDESKHLLRFRKHEDDESDAPTDKPSEEKKSDEKKPADDTKPADDKPELKPVTVQPADEKPAPDEKPAEKPAETSTEKKE